MLGRWHSPEELTTREPSLGGDRLRRIAPQLPDFGRRLHHRGRPDLARAFRWSRRRPRRAESFRIGCRPECLGGPPGRPVRPRRSWLESSSRAHRKDAMPTLALAAGGPITSVVPTTTAPRSTSLATGAPHRCDHRMIVGYRVRANDQRAQCLEMDDGMTMTRANGSSSRKRLPTDRSPSSRAALRRSCRAVNSKAPASPNGAPR